MFLDYEQDLVLAYSTVVPFCAQVAESVNEVALFVPHGMPIQKRCVTLPLYSLQSAWAVGEQANQSAVHWF